MCTAICMLHGVHVKMCGRWTHRYWLRQQSQSRDVSGEDSDLC